MVDGWRTKPARRALLAFNTNFGGRTAMTERTETAILAGGCFWPAQELLRHRDGVISTRVGYTGGENDNRTADHHPGHAEAVEVIFDPERTAYRDILEFFFQIHRPDLGEEVVGSDYRSEVFYTSEVQRQVAEDRVADAEASGLWPSKVVTKVSEAGRFWAAEPEDQDYLQHYPDGKNQFSP
jgi:peptide-methionine (S)-S-oxide reductase